METIYPFGVKITEQKHLPPGTILVSPDVAAFLREKYTEIGRDQEFLRKLGIEPATREKIQ